MRIHRQHKEIKRNAIFQLSTRETCVLSFNLVKMLMSCFLRKCLISANKGVGLLTCDFLSKSPLFFRKAKLIIDFQVDVQFLFPVNCFTELQRFKSNFFSRDLWSIRFHTTFPWLLKRYPDLFYNCLSQT